MTRDVSQRHGTDNTENFGTTTVSGPLGEPPVHSLYFGIPIELRAAGP